MVGPDSPCKVRHCFGILDIVFDIGIDHKQKSEKSNKPTAVYSRAYGSRFICHSIYLSSMRRKKHKTFGWICDQDFLNVEYSYLVFPRRNIQLLFWQMSKKIDWVWTEAKKNDSYQFFVRAMNFLAKRRPHVKTKRNFKTDQFPLENLHGLFLISSFWTFDDFTYKIHQLSWNIEAGTITIVIK